MLELLGSVWTNSGGELANLRWEDNAEPLKGLWAIKNVVLSGSLHTWVSVSLAVVRHHCSLLGGGVGTVWPKTGAGRAMQYAWHGLNLRSKTGGGKAKQRGLVKVSLAKGAASENVDDMIIEREHRIPIAVNHNPQGWHTAAPHHKVQLRAREPETFQWNGARVDFFLDFAKDVQNKTRSHRDLAHVHEAGTTTRIAVSSSVLGCSGWNKASFW